MAFRNQDEDTALEQYSMHDIGEEYAKRRLSAFDIEETGFDGREIATDGGIVGGKPDEYTEDADLRVNGVPIDIKTTQYPEYIGNVEQSVWEKYPADTWIVALVVQDQTVTETVCYQKQQTEMIGQNTNPYGETYLEPDADSFVSFETFKTQLRA